MMTEDEPTKDLNGEDPTKDLTADLTDRQLLETILARLSNVEAYIAARPETNPLWERIYKEVAELSIGQTEIKGRLDAMEKELRLMNRKFDVFAQDITKARVDVRDIEERLAALESRPN